MAVKRRTFMKLASAGLATAVLPLACSEQPEQYGTSRYPSPQMPLTPTPDWYFVSIQGAYEADLDGYELKINGMVNDGLRLSINELRNRYEEHLIHDTMCCVGQAPTGGLLSSAIFRGVRLRDVLEDAGISSRATSAMISGLDGFVAMRPIEDLLRDEVMLAYHMGITEEELAPLAIENGFPLRILTPGFYGYTQPKWLDEITFVDDGNTFDVLQRSIDYFDGHIQLASDFGFPRDGANVQAGPVELHGWAYGDGRQINIVEIRVDDGPWEPVEIAWNSVNDELPSYVWSIWRWQWEAAPGEYELAVRATYADGDTQYFGRDFPYSGGSISKVDVTVSE